MSKNKKELLPLDDLPGMVPIDRMQMSSYVPTTILGRLVPDNPNVRYYDEISKILLDRVVVDPTSRSGLFRSWGIFTINTDSGAIEATDEYLKLKSDVKIVPASQGTPSQTSAKDYYIACQIVENLKISGTKRANKVNSLSSDEDIEQKIATTSRELLGKWTETFDTKIEESLKVLELSSQSKGGKGITKVQEESLKLSIGAPTLVKGASDIGQNLNAQEFLSCRILKSRSENGMDASNELGDFFKYKEIPSIFNVSSDKLSALSSIAATSNFEDPNDHTGGLFDTFCPRKGEGVREAVNIIPAVVWGVARLLSGESITSSEKIIEIKQIYANFQEKYTESFRQTDIPLKPSSAGVSPVSSIPFFSDGMFNIYESYFINIYSCIKAINQYNCTRGASLDICEQQNFEFGVDVAESLKIIEENCKTQFLSGRLQEDIEYHLNELLNLHNAYDRFFTTQMDEAMDIDEAVDPELRFKEFAYDNTFKFIRKLLNCYGEYYMGLSIILKDQSKHITEFILNEIDTSSAMSLEQQKIYIDTKYLQIAKTWYARSGLEQYMTMSDTKIAESLIEKNIQTLKFMSIDTGYGHDFPFNELKKVIINSGWFNADELNHVNEGVLLIKLLKRFKCVSVVSSEDQEGPKTYSILSLDPGRNLLTSTSILYSGIPIYKMVSSISLKCNVHFLNIDYSSITQVTPLTSLAMINTLETTIDIMKNYMNKTITHILVTPSTKFDLAAPVKGCFVETGKHSTIFYKKDIPETKEILVIAFLTYDTDRQAHNDLELRTLGCLSKYVKKHDFYSIDELADFFESQRFSDSEDFRKLVDKFVDGSASIGLGDRGESANNTNRISDELLQKYYKDPKSIIKTILSSSTQLPSDDCEKILQQIKKLFEEIDIYRLNALNKKGEVHKKTYRTNSVIFLNGLKELIGNSYIKYLSDKIDKDCFDNIKSILEILVECVTPDTGRAMEVFDITDTDAEVKRIIATRTAAIAGLAELKDPNRYDSTPHTNRVGLGLGLGQNESLDSPFSQLSEYSEFEDDDNEDETAAIEEVLEEFSKRTLSNKYRLFPKANEYYSTLTGTTEERKESLKNFLNDRLDKSNAKKLRGFNAGKRTRRQRKKTNKRKTIKHRKIKHKKYTRPFNIKIGKKNTCKK
jgi:hypothetical protein